jgi:hypothetical protein
MLKLLFKRADIFRLHRHVVPRVIADLEAVFVQRLDLLPRHAGVRFRATVQPFGNKERRAEAVLL